MLCSVISREHNDRHTQLNVANCLAEQIEEVGEVADGAHKGWHAVHVHFAGQLIGQEQVIQAALYDVGQVRLFDLSDTVLGVNTETLTRGHTCLWKSSDWLPTSCAAYSFDSNSASIARTADL
jgi:hypothetical protein